MYVDFLKSNIVSENIDCDAKAFETKATAQFLRESWVIPEIVTNAPDLVGHYATVAPPVGDILTTEAAFVPVASPNAACAWDFIRFLREQEQQLSLVTIVRLAAGPQRPRPDLRSSRPTRRTKASSSSPPASR